MGQPEYQDHLGHTVYPPYSGIIAERWRFARWEDIAESDRNEAEIEFRNVLAMFPADMINNIIDIELVGSYAFGRAGEMSDWDITFVPVESMVQEYRSLWWGAAKATNFMPILEYILEMQNSLGIKIEFMFGQSAKSTCCYSFGEHRIYGRQPGETLNKKCQYNLVTGLYELIEPIEKHILHCSR